MRTCAILLTLMLAGCGSPALMVEVNGRKLEFDEYRYGKMPKGVEVSHVDSTTIQVQGDLAIEVNGIPVQAQGDGLVIGGRKITVDRDAKVLVHDNGEIEVKVSSRSTASAPPPAK